MATTTAAGRSDDLRGTTTALNPSNLTTGVPGAADAALRATQLRNCAVWNMDRHDLAMREGRASDAERHDQTAFRLFKAARDLSGAA